jgi:hypothetical protein
VATLELSLLPLFCCVGAIESQTKIRVIRESGRLGIGVAYGWMHAFLHRRLRELNTKCPKAMEAYTKCMDYYSNEFEMCRKQQQEFEATCPL